MEINKKEQENITIAQEFDFGVPFQMLNGEIYMRLGKTTEVQFVGMAAKEPYFPAVRLSDGFTYAVHQKAKAKLVKYEFNILEDLK